MKPTPITTAPAIVGRQQAAVARAANGRLDPPWWLAAVMVALTTLWAGTADAHEAEAIGSGFASGFTHPLLGPDHVVAMVAVGLWGSILGMPAIWVLPVAFPLVMALGGALGVIGVPVPGVETGIAVSAIVLGCMVAAAVRPPLWVAAVVVAVFAVFHGHAHGTELPDAANPIAYSLGFVIATGLLHLAGIGVGALYGSASGRVVVRTIGGVIAVAGVAFVAGLF